MADLERARRIELLAEIERTGHITTGQAHRFYRATGYGPCRTTARKDLQYYVRQGVLLERGADNKRIFHLNTARGGLPMTIRLAAWWTATTVTAASAESVAEIPFTGPYASIAGVVAAAGVCLAGFALAPHTRKDGA